MTVPCTSPSRPPWHHGDAPVTGDLLGVVIWTGRTWAATTYGVERLDGGQAISERHLGLDWIARMAVRTGADLPDFVAALSISRQFHGVRDAESARLFAALCIRHQVNGYSRPKGKPSSRQSP